MGYGGKENLFEHTGKSHDGGIDGVIKQDPLGIQNIYIQAKRYASDNMIGSKELQSFSGGITGQWRGTGCVYHHIIIHQIRPRIFSKIIGQNCPDWWTRAGWFND